MRAGAVYDVDGDLYFPVTADPRFGRGLRLDREQMLEVFAERGGDPDRPGSATRSTACCGSASATGRAGVGLALRRRSARLARRVRGDRPHLPGRGLRRPRRRYGPDLPPPRDVGRARAGRLPGDRRSPRPTSTRHGRFRGPQDVEVARQPRPRLETTCGRRRAGGDPAGAQQPALPRDWDWTSGLLDDATKRLAAWRDAVRRSDQTPTRP